MTNPSVEMRSEIFWIVRPVRKRAVDRWYDIILINGQWGICRRDFWGTLNVIIYFG